jgi:hypothetical protein
MAELKEQRICIMFCFILEKTAPGTFEVLKRAGYDDAMSRRQTFEWY